MALSIKDEKVNTTAIEIFSQFVEVVPTLVREFILKEVESRLSVSYLKTSTKQQHQQQQQQNSLPSTPTSSNSINFASSSSSSSSSTLLAPPSTPNSKDIDNQSSAMTENAASSSVTAGASCASPFSSPSHKTIEAVTATATTGSEINSTTNISSILKIDEDFEPILINFVIRQMMFDPDQELSGALQIINLLKLLIDPENMLSGKYVASVINFLFFYLTSSTSFY